MDGEGEELWPREACQLLVEHLRFADHAQLTASLHVSTVCTCTLVGHYFLLGLEF